MRSGFLIGEAIIGVPSTNVLVVVLSKSFLLMLGKLLVVFEVVVKVAELASSFSILIPSTLTPSACSFSTLSSSVAAMCLCSYYKRKIAKLP